MTPTASTERWRPVVGWDGVYEVSDRGRVRSVPRTDARGDQRYGRMLSRTSVAHPGRPLRWGVLLCRNGRKQSRRVAGLVAEAFLGPRPDGHDVHHIDGDPSNDRVENLVYRDRHTHASDHTRGILHHQAKLTEAKVRDIRRRAALGERRGAIAGSFGVGRRTIDRIVARQTWRHVE